MLVTIARGRESLDDESERCRERAVPNVRSVSPADRTGWPAGGPLGHSVAHPWAKADARRGHVPEIVRTGSAIHFAAHAGPWSPRTPLGSTHVVPSSTSAGVPNERSSTRPSRSTLSRSSLMSRREVIGLSPTSSRRSSATCGSRPAARPEARMREVASTRLCVPEGNSGRAPRPRGRVPQGL